VVAARPYAEQIREVIARVIFWVLLTERMRRRS